MTGPEHYKAAEQDIDLANGASLDDGWAQFYMARAQVHATLARAAATWDAPMATRMGSWSEALS
jgi:hypothetical protein